MSSKKSGGKIHEICYCLQETVLGWYDYSSLFVPITYWTWLWGKDVLRARGVALWNQWIEMAFPLYCLYQELIDVKGNIQTRLLPDSKYGKRHYTGYVHLPVSGTRRLLYPRVDVETIVVYMDVTKGNPLHAKNVVRWMCYYNCFPNDDTWYSPTDLFFDYRSQFNDPKLIRKVVFSVYSTSTKTCTSAPISMKGNC